MCMAVAKTGSTQDRAHAVTKKGASLQLSSWGVPHAVQSRHGIATWWQETTVGESDTASGGRIPHLEAFEVIVDMLRACADSRQTPTALSELCGYMPSRDGSWATATAGGCAFMA